MEPFDIIPGLIINLKKLKLIANDLIIQDSPV